METRGEVLLKKRRIFLLNPGRLEQIPGAHADDVLLVLDVVLELVQVPEPDAAATTVVELGDASRVGVTSFL